MIPLPPLSTSAQFPIIISYGRPKNSSAHLSLAIVGKEGGIWGCPKENRKVNVTCSIHKSLRGFRTEILHPVCQPWKELVIPGEHECIPDLFLTT